MAKVTVHQPVVVESVAGPDWVCSGESATLTAAATGEGTLSYAWSRSADGTSFTPVAGATGASLATGPLTAPTWFKVEVSSESCGPAGMIKSIGLGAAPVISTPPANAVVQAGQTTTLSVSGTGSAPLSFQWYQGESGDTSNPAAGATAAEFTPPPPAATVPVTGSGSPTPAGPWTARRPQ